VQLAALDAHRRIRRQPGGDLGVGVVHQAGQLPQMSARVGLQPQHGQHARALTHPQPLRDQSGPRVAPPVRADRVHVAAPQRRMQGLQDAEHIGRPVDQRRIQLGIAEH
jgi:hypothetical protein